MGHTALAHHFFNGSTLMEDRCNKYEWSYGKLRVDEINHEESQEEVEEWVRSLERKGVLEECLGILTAKTEARLKLATEEKEGAGNAICSQLFNPITEDARQLAIQYVNEALAFTSPIALQRVVTLSLPVLLSYASLKFLENQAMKRSDFNKHFREITPDMRNEFIERLNFMLLRPEKKEIDIYINNISLDEPFEIFLEHVLPSTTQQTNIGDKMTRYQLPEIEFEGERNCWNCCMATNDDGLECIFVGVSITEFYSEHAKELAPDWCPLAKVAEAQL